MSEISTCVFCNGKRNYAVPNTKVNMCSDCWIQISEIFMAEVYDNK